VRADEIISMLDLERLLGPRPVSSHFDHDASRLDGEDSYERAHPAAREGVLAPSATQQGSLLRRDPRSGEYLPDL
jgi:hypothetical protein